MSIHWRNHLTSSRSTAGRASSGTRRLRVAKVRNRRAVVSLWSFKVSHNDTTTRRKTSPQNITPLRFGLLSMHSMMEDRQDQKRQRDQRE